MMGLILEQPMTNRQKAALDPEFLVACKLSGVHPSREQYRKFKWGKGRAFEAWTSLRTSEQETLLRNETIVLTGSWKSG